MNNTALPAIDGPFFANVLLSGIHRVAESQDVLNRINVFPVADGDTGTNLALTMIAARDTLSNAGTLPLGALLARVADALLDSARGNSGAIMAQFFQGLSDACSDVRELSAPVFANAVKQASGYAREALSEPQEGTVLSVISAFSDELSRAMSGNNFRRFFQRGMDAAKIALARTPEQLAVLKKNGVVDAGAQGFVNLLEGMNAYLTHQKLPDLSSLGAVPENSDFADTAGETEDLDYRYCTECIVTGKNIERRKLREALSEIGGSLVLAGTHSKAKIHIHSNDPQAVYSIAGCHGLVSSEKADDMHRQQRSSHTSNERVAIITDSAADIPDTELEELDIHMVPLRLHFGERGFMDKLSISAREFYDELQRNPSHPKTSQPAPGDFRRQFQFLASHFRHVLAFSVTGTVSGTLNAAHSAAKRTNGPGRIHVIDTRNASVGQGLCVTHAARMALAGASIDEITAATEVNIEKTRSFALLKDLNFAVRGGRIPAYARWLAESLRLNPVLGTKPDGRVKPVGVLLGRSNRIRKFAGYIARRCESRKNYRLSIGHAECSEDADALADALATRLLLAEPPALCELGAAIGVHGGAGTLVAAIQEVPEETG